MTNYLVFQLYGPMAAWGDVAVGEARVSANRPGRSALIGLLAAALGIRREDEDMQVRLAADYLFAVRVVSSGSFLRDYHTVQVPSKAAMKGRPGRTRRDELALPRDDLGTILSFRYYRSDAHYHVAVEAATEDPHWSLAQLADALKVPQLPLYMGRKSCPLALPLQPRLVEAETLDQAFIGLKFVGPDELLEDVISRRTRKPSGSHANSVYWDDGMTTGVAARETFTRRDQPRTRRRWQFDERQERHGMLPDKE